MKRTFLSLMVAALLSTAACAQNTKDGAFSLSGYTLSDAGALKGKYTLSSQGMAISGNYMVALYDSGLASLFYIHPDGSCVCLSSFPLGSQSKYNHANVASFGVEKFNKRDVLPVLYVSQTRTDPDRGTTNVCYVERISGDGSSKLVQTIVLDNHDQYYGNAVQWLVDKKRKRLVGFGNTTNNYDKGNRFRIMTFRLPKLRQGEKVVLKKDDIIENYLIQDYDPSFPSVQVGQGGTIAGNCIVMPTGIGSEEYPSMLYSWDLKRHCMVSAVNMQREIPIEFEDCDLRDGRLYLRCQSDRLFVLNWKTKP